MPRKIKIDHENDRAVLKRRLNAIAAEKYRKNKLEAYKAALEIIKQQRDLHQESMQLATAVLLELSKAVGMMKMDYERKREQWPFEHEFNTTKFHKKISKLNFEQTRILDDVEKIQIPQKRSPMMKMEEDDQYLTEMSYNQACQMLQMDAASFGEENSTLISQPPQQFQGQPKRFNIPHQNFCMENSNHNFAIDHQPIQYPANISYPEIDMSSPNFSPLQQHSYPNNNSWPNSTNSSSSLEKNSEISHNFVQTYRGRNSYTSVSSSYSETMSEYKNVYDDLDNINIQELLPYKKC